MILGLDISTSIIGFTIIDQGEIVKTFAVDLRNKNKYPDIYSLNTTMFRANCLIFSENTA